MQSSTHMQADIMDIIIITHIPGPSLVTSPTNSCPGITGGWIYFGRESLPIYTEEDNWNNTHALLSYQFFLGRTFSIEVRGQSLHGFKDVYMQATTN